MAIKILPYSFLAGEDGGGGKLLREHSLSFLVLIPIIVLTMDRPRLFDHTDRYIR